jgi:hypothetical protein
MLHTTAEAFAASEIHAAAPLRTKRSARRHCARGLVAPLTRPALAVHLNCHQPRHDVSETDQLRVPPSLPRHRHRTQRLTLLRVLWSLPLHSLRGLFRLMCALVFVCPRTPAVHSQKHRAGGHLLLHELPERVLPCATEPEPQSTVSHTARTHSTVQAPTRFFAQSTRVEKTRLIAHGKLVQSLKEIIFVYGSMYIRSI